MSHRLGVLAGLLLAATPLPALEPATPLSLDALATAGSFTVRVDGPSRQSPWSGRACVYFEWSYAETAKGGAVTTRWRGYQSDAPFTVKTPGGDVEVSRAQVRTHLAPSYTRTFTRRDADQAPEPVAARIKEEGKPLTVEEYCLSPGRDYHARVRVETYHLPPPDQDSPPAEGRNTVLLLADKPFKGDQPPRPLTPGYQGWTY
jgi:hypothetical protein